MKTIWTSESGFIRNISAFDLSNNFYFTFTIDCKKLLFGIDTSPVNPVRGSTVSETAYKKVCKKYNIDFYHSDRILYDLDRIHNKGIKISY